MASEAPKVDPWTLRGLQEGEMDKWLDHLAAAFADKGTPRAYFQGHYDRDPWRDCDGIRVCVDHEGAIASTARVFVRQMQVNGAVVSFGGIGEVATGKVHRGMGLAPRVLEDAIAFMEARGFALAVLHTSQPPLQQYYAKHGFTSVRMPFVRSTATKAALALSCSAAETAALERKDIVEHVSCAAVPEALVGTLQDLDALYSSQAPRFNGTVLRGSVDYWRDWVLEDSCKPNSSLWVYRAAEGAGRLSAYLAVRVRTNSATNDQTLELREYFCMCEMDDLNSRLQFNALLKAALQHHDSLLGESFKVVAHEGMIPRPWIPSLTVEEFADCGWMYRALRACGDVDVVEMVAGKCGEKECVHFLSSLDSF